MTEKRTIDLNDKKEQESVQTQPVLVVDLDGTLIKTDLLFEGFVRVLKHYPWKLLVI